MLLGREGTARVGAPLFADLETIDLPPGEVQRHRPQLVDDPAVTTGGVGLALERAKLAPDLAQEVGEAQQVALGRFEATLRLLAPLAELQDPGRFLDDGAAILGTRVEHRVELALADDHVLLAPDARVGEQLLDVEQPAGCAVDHVLRLAGTEQRAGDRDLGELDRQHTGGVVDRERDFRATQRRALGGAREDDVVHLSAAQGAGALRAEHPCHGVDDV